MTSLIRTLRSVPSLSVLERFDCICSYYRPNVSEEVSVEHLNESLNRIRHEKCHLWLACDFNLPGLDWSTGTIKQNCNSPTLHEQFLDMIDDNSLTQLVTQPSRQNNTLYLSLCNNPSLFENVKVLPGLADHDVVLVEGNISPMNRQQTHTKKDLPF